MRAARECQTPGCDNAATVVMGGQLMCAACALCLFEAQQSERDRRAAPRYDDWNEVGRSDR